MTLIWRTSYVLRSFKYNVSIINIYFQIFYNLICFCIDTITQGDNDVKTTADSKYWISSSSALLWCDWNVDVLGSWRKIGFKP